MAWPEEFIEQPDTIGQVDSFVLLSRDGYDRLRYFVEGEVKRDDYSKNYLYEYFHTIESGAQYLVKGCKVIQSRICFYAKCANNRGYFIIIGQTDEKELIWKTVLSEVPISGDLTFKTMYFSYPITLRYHYQPIGMFLSKNFGDYLDARQLEE